MRESTFDIVLALHLGCFCLAICPIFDIRYCQSYIERWEIRIPESSLSFFASGGGLYPAGVEKNFLPHQPNPTTTPRKHTPNHYTAQNPPHAMQHRTHQRTSGNIPKSRLFSHFLRSSRRSHDEPPSRRTKRDNSGSGRA